MNFIPCRLEQNGAGMRRAYFRYDRISRSRIREAPLPGAWSEKTLLLGLRPEHITEPRHNGREDGRDFTVTLDVVEPMGMETMVFFTVNGTEICGRVRAEQCR